MMLVVLVLVLFLLYIHTIVMKKTITILQWTRQNFENFWTNNFIVDNDNPDHYHIHVLHHDHLIKVLSVVNYIRGVYLPWMQTLEMYTRITTKWSRIRLEAVQAERNQQTSLQQTTTRSLDLHHDHNVDLDHILDLNGVTMTFRFSCELWKKKGARKRKRHTRNTLNPFERKVLWVCTTNDNKQTLNCFLLIVKPAPFHPTPSPHTIKKVAPLLHWWKKNKA